MADGYGAPWLPGAVGELGELIAARDWSASLGPISGWPAELHGVLGTCLSSQVPMHVWWGQDLVQLYNTASVAVLGDRHPHGLGRPAAHTWSEAWHELGPPAAKVLAGGGSQRTDEQLLLVNRAGYPEETYWRFAFSPVHDSRGGVGGVFVTTDEVTDRVLNSRRLRLVGELGRVAELPENGTRDAATACRAAIEVLGEAGADVPFAIGYVVDEHRDVHRVAATTTLPPLGEREAVRRVATSGHPETLGGLSRVLGDGFRPPVGTVTPDTAVVLPVMVCGTTEPAVVLVFGVSAHRELDEEYRMFQRLVAGQVSTAVTAAVTGAIRSDLALSRLREREARFRRALVDSLQEGFFVTDTEGAVVDMNRAFAAITGYGQDGGPYAWPFPWLSDRARDPEDRAEQDAVFAAFVRDGGGEFTVPIRHRDGRRVVVRLSSTVAPGRENGEQVYVGTLRDVTEDLAAAERDAELGRFAAALAACADVREVLTVAATELRAVLDARLAVAAYWSPIGSEIVAGSPPVNGPGDLPADVRSALADA
ncbi:MAG TPA: PAS domain S-box protein, partial [Pseudonocardiaceae bacterium]